MTKIYFLRRKPGGTWSPVKMNGQVWETSDPAEANRAAKQLRDQGYEVKRRTRKVGGNPLTRW